MLCYICCCWHPRQDGPSVATKWKANNLPSISCYPWFGGIFYCLTKHLRIPGLHPETPDTTWRGDVVPWLGVKLQAEQQIEFPYSWTTPALSLPWKFSWPGWFVQVPQTTMRYGGDLISWAVNLFRARWEQVFCCTCRIYPFLEVRVPVLSAGRDVSSGTPSAVVDALPLLWDRGGGAMKQLIAHFFPRGK